MFFLCLLQKTHHSSLNKEASYQEKNLYLFPVCQEVTTETSMSQQQRIEGAGGGAQSVKRHCESIRSWLWIANAQIKRQVQWCVPEEEVTGNPKATMTSQSSSTRQLQGQWQILSPNIGWRVTETPTLTMHVHECTCACTHTHLSTLTQMYKHTKEKMT